MGRRFVLYAACCVAALLAAGVVWVWLGAGGPRSTQLAAAPRTALARPHARPLPLVPSRAETEPETAPLVVDPGASDTADVAADASLPAPSSAATTTPMAEGPAPEETTAPELHAAGDTTLADDPAPADDTHATPPAPARTREVSLTRLQLWSQPGMCASTGDVLSLRAALAGRFQYWDGAELGQFHVDARLPLEAVNPILGYIVEAEREIATRLKLRATRPEAFVYFDKQLLTAVACINAEVVAYYDGALHVVASDPDLRASVLHEYTHHVLISSGLLGPAWAQEGIAMNIAGETWWKERRWYRTLLDRPFGIDDLDTAIPYKLPSDQALQFYVQSAALVACVLESKRWGLDALFEVLSRRGGVPGETMIYELPEVEHTSFLRGCLERWNK